MSRGETAKILKKSLEQAMVGQGDKEVQNGRDFYKFFFTNYPDLRKYFKGAESFTADDVQKSERFMMQGQRIILAQHLLAHTYEDERVFKSYIREMQSRHVQYKMDPALWMAFWTVWTGFLDTKGKLDDATRAAWMTLGKEFNAETQAYLKGRGLPSA